VCRPVAKEAGPGRGKKCATQGTEAAAAEEVIVLLVFQIIRQNDFSSTLHRRSYGRQRDA
jgi:hypothetical protein